MFVCLFSLPKYQARITQKFSAIVRTTNPIRRTGKTDEMESCFSAYGFYYVSGWEVLFVALEFLASSTLKEPVR